MCCFKEAQWFTEAHVCFKLVNLGRLKKSTSPGSHCIIRTLITPPNKDFYPPPLFFLLSADSEGEKCIRAVPCCGEKCCEQEPWGKSSKTFMKCLEISPQLTQCALFLNEENSPTVWFKKMMIIPFMFRYFLKSTDNLWNESNISYLECVGVSLL